MSIRSRLAASVLTLILSGIVAAPTLAIEREGPRRGDPIIRIIKRLLLKFVIAPNDEIAVPKP